MKRTLLVMISKWIFSRDSKLKKRIWIFLGGFAAVSFLVAGISIWGVFQAAGFVYRNLAELHLPEKCMQTARATLNAEFLFNKPLIQTWNQLSEDCLQKPKRSSNPESESPKGDSWSI